jgi:chemotaxis regulatin CheY-phosphate phosphatase CheZ
MADQVQEVVTALTIETGKSYASIAELREAVRGLREELKQKKFEDEDFNKVQKELIATQEALTQVTKMSTAAQAENWEGVDLGTKSYNELTKQMKALNAEWRATTDATQRKQLGEQILAINNRLKELDASTGNFQRNVGDYANQMKAGMEAFTKAAGNAIPSINGLKNAADAFARNPMIAALGLIVNLFGIFFLRN